MNRKGNETVEAAIVLPVFILIILSLIMLMIYFYARLDVQCGVHSELIESAMREEVSVYETRTNNRETSSHIGGLAGIFLRSDYEESIAVINEGDIIRLGEIVEG